MKNILIILLASLILSGCKKNNAPPYSEEIPIDPCSLLKDGVYQYPLVPPDSGVTGKAFYEYWNIPEAVLPCLTTRGLLKTCLKYRQLCQHFMMGGLNGIQSGYDYVKIMLCRGFPELEKRKDALDVLIEEYKSINTVDYDTVQTLKNILEYGGYDFFTYCMEIILGQYAFLQNASIKQKIALLSELFVKQNFREHRVTWFYFEGPAFVMARLMYLDNFKPFMDYYTSSSRIQYFVTWARPIYEEHRSVIVSQAKEYFNLLEIK